MLQAQDGTSLGVNGSSPATHACVTLPRTDVNITLDFGVLLGSFTNGLLMKNGNLRFPLPDLQASVSVTAKPVLPDLSGQGSVSKLGLISSELGRASLEVNGLNAYTATFTVTQQELLAAALLNPSFTGLYQIELTAVSADPDVNDWLSQADTLAFESLICNPLIGANMP